MMAKPYYPNLDIYTDETKIQFLHLIGQYRQCDCYIDVRCTKHGVYEDIVIGFDTKLLDRLVYAGLSFEDMDFLISEGSFRNFATTLSYWYYEDYLEQS
jgi:hypothetical protein